MSKRPDLGDVTAASSEICRLSAVELSARLRRRSLSARETAEAFLDQIDRVNPTYNAIVSLRPREEILREATAMDRDHQAGEAGPLFGLPMAIKDLALTKGLRTTFGSRIFAENVPDEDSIHVARLRRAGALIIGKTNTPEFGLGSNTFNKVFGATRNAYDPSLTAGGSSGGAAAALALRMVPLADGSDTGGSLRNPSAYNNVFGFRPSIGRVPAGPEAEAFMNQLGTPGMMGRSVADLALGLSVIAGRDWRAPLSIDGKPDYLAEGLIFEPEGRRIGWLGDLGGHLPMEAGVLETCEKALAILGDLGCAVEPVAPRFDMEKVWRSFVTLRHFIVAGRLKRHYEDPARRPQLKSEVVWEVESAAKLSAHDVYSASETRTAWYNEVLRLFRTYDFLALPSAQVFPFTLGQSWPKQIAGVPMDSYHRWMEVSAPGTLSGCPIINVPAGFDPAGRPKTRSMGVQLIGPPRADLETLRLAYAYEQACPWITTAP